MALIGCLTSCNLTESVAEELANPECTPLVQKMTAALSEQRAADAKALMHPERAEESDAAIAQMIAFLKGRTVTDMALVSINVNKSTGTEGAMRKETAAYRVTLNDGTVIYLNTAYLTSDDAAGFSSFQIVLGVI